MEEKEKEDDNVKRKAVEEQQPEEDIKHNEEPKSASFEAADFPIAGVRFSYIVNEFFEKDWGGLQALKGLKTHEVLEQVLKPLTFESQSSYCDLLKEQGHPAYAPQANVFVSHAHDEEFLTLLSALHWQLRGEEETAIIWLDVLSINQHQPMVWTFEWLSTTFQTAIQTFGRTVMIMSPWNHPKPFTRAWCIYEAFCTAKQQQPAASSQPRQRPSLTNQANGLEIAMSKYDRDSFLEDMRENPEEALSKLLTTIRAQDCQCSVESDRKFIFEAIEKSAAKDGVGFSKLDAMVFEQYRQWMIQVPLEALEQQYYKMTHRSTFDDEDEQEEKEELLALHHTAGFLYLQNGDCDEAMHHLKKCLKLRRELFGQQEKGNDDNDDSPEWLIVYGTIGRVHEDQGRHETAKDYYETYLDKCKALLGERHPDTLEAQSSLAGLYHLQGKFEISEQLQASCVEECKHVLGTDHAKTLLAMNSLAVLWIDQGKFDQAESLLETTLAKQKAVLGPNHNDTLYAMNSLAQVYSQQENYEQAQSLYEQVWNRRRTIFGEYAKSTIRALNNLAGLFYRRGEYDEAQSRLELCWEKRRELYGDNHPDTLSSLNNLAILHCTLKNYDKAQELYKDLWENHKTALGEHHPSTLNVINSLGGLYEGQGKFVKAAYYYKLCLDKRRSKLGKAHPSTTVSMMNLAGLYCNHGNFEEALPILKECVAARIRGLGELHPETLNSMRAMGYCFQRQGDYNSARRVYKACLDKYKAVAAADATALGSDDKVKEGEDEEEDDQDIHDLEYNLQVLDSPPHVRDFLLQQTRVWIS